MKRLKYFLWLSVCVPMVSMADLTWRVDFNGATSGSESTPTFTGWAVGTASRTQTFSNVDGGPINSDITITLNGTGGTTHNNYQRNMPGGSATNLFRDAAQYNGLDAGDSLTINMSGLDAGGSYQLRLWYYDYSFGSSATQSFFDVTDGGNTFLGSLTNTANSVAAGNPALPTDLYDSRYVLTADVNAGVGGTLAINLVTGNSNQKINGLELIAVVPEPSSVALFGVSGVVCWFWRRRQRAG